MTLTFSFALISFLALKEYCTLISIHFPRWLYWVIPLNYLLIGFNCFELFLLFIPLSGFLILATWRVFVGEPSGFLHTVSAIFWGWIMTVFALSHAAWLLMFPSITSSMGVTGVDIFGINRVKRYCTVFGGENPAAEEKWSPKSALEKRWKVWWGRHHHHDCVTDYWTVADTAKYITGIISGFVNWY